MPLKMRNLVFSAHELLFSVPVHAGNLDAASYNECLTTRLQTVTNNYSRK